jgi:hypothetical protein
MRREIDLKYLHAVEGGTLFLVLILLRMRLVLIPLQLMSEWCCRESIISPDFRHNALQLSLSSILLLSLNHRKGWNHNELKKINLCLQRDNKTSHLAMRNILKRERERGSE